ncbi:hypothetical protein Sa4125_30040 [Aureimonas sp. SA4125]|uniref:hypothetical protein n=1 Tax=Aureimonas sp. SA4125 TaxID=2826993 RepID=UPI001CC73D17|nr:hypothetical protein [Aureimonas sp. SA4125]BDA85462.1 hypothetical protein Sa4125_30040 [Aureimonas sp. SA4125]
MNESRIPVTLVIVDTGPLISLAACDRLDLLDQFSLRVRVTDVVKSECLRYPNKVGGNVLGSWFGQFDGKICHVVKTPFLETWQDAVRQEEAGDETHPSKGIGDASIAWLLQRINASPPQEEIVLLLSEDAPFGNGAVLATHPEVYMLSTRMFLKVLENFEIIESASQIISDIADAGRTVSRYASDRPGKIAPGLKSQWTDPLKRT